ncbi:hypothetical protein [Streptomyces sp. NPDC058066]|uniref:hypothetical protein n=1 Tax=Streptomyces sp. NPDC058066 TaxID=3346323 RepID=UPI0036E20EBC
MIPDAAEPLLRVLCSRFFAARSFKGGTTIRVFEPHRIARARAEGRLHRVLFPLGQLLDEVPRGLGALGASLPEDLQTGAGGFHKDEPAVTAIDVRTLDNHSLYGHDDEQLHTVCNLQSGVGQA